MLIVLEKKDKREEYLAKLLKNDGYIVYSSKSNFLPQTKKVYVMSISTTLQEDEAKKLEDNSIVFARDVSPQIKNIFAGKNITYFNYNKDEEFVTKNAYITAEGALAHIIKNTDLALIDLRVLVLGYGRVGKAMCKVLKNNDVYTAISTNSKKEQELSKNVADKTYNLEEYILDIADFDVIVNTIPQIILKGEALNLIDKECFIIDLASAPGGLDYAAAKRMQKRHLHALGVPGKTAPKTAARYLKESIIKSLKI